MRSEQAITSLLGKRRMAGTTIVGSGLLSLDVIEANTSREYQAGGTCGNVLTILSYLGWASYPVARLGQDFAAGLVRSDLSSFGVELRHSSLAPVASTPIIRHVIRSPAVGTPTHRFTLRCPECAAWLPTFRPVVASSVRDSPGLLELASTARVFFMDRVSPSALGLAMAARDGGGIVVFEPSTALSDSEIRAATALAHVVKYSDENARKWPSLASFRVPLEIMTLGARGLRFRRTYADGRRTRWAKSGSWSLPEVVDTAGAGDWCTAILIHVLAAEGAIGFSEVLDAEIEDALDVAQAAAAWNCTFLGARGGMYSTKREHLADEITAAVTTPKSGKAYGSAQDRTMPKLCEDFRDLCSRCT